jgi:hypothetical protein
MDNVNVKDNIKKKHLEYKYNQKEVDVETTKFNFEDDIAVPQDEDNSLFNKIILSIKL